MAHTTQKILSLASLILVTTLTTSAMAQSAGEIAPPPSEIIPLPDPIAPSTDDPNNPLAVPQGSPANGFDPARSQGTSDGETSVEVLYDLELLPRPVKKMRDLIMDAARSGDPEQLRALIGSGGEVTQLSFGEIDGDPIEYIRSVSGDSQGHEMLAILLEVMEAGYVRFDAGTPNELYVWPYFYAMPLEKLTPKQRVELFKLVTAGDYEDMLSFGAYIFFRVGITPQGRWVFFVAGD